MSPFPQTTRVDWIAVETSRRRQDFAQILQLAMWICKISFVDGALRPTSPLIHVRFYESIGILLCRSPTEGIPEVQAERF